MRIKIAIFALLFVVIFALMNSTPQSGLGVGTMALNRYGWPSPWLQVERHHTVSSVNDVLSETNRIEKIEILDGKGLFVSVAVAAVSGAAIVAVPVLFLSRRRAA